MILHSLGGAIPRRLSLPTAGLGLLAVLCAFPPPARGSEPAVVFQNGSGPYACYRIPALAVSKDGTLLAFAEGRRTCHDHSHNDLVLKISTDGGRSWGAPQILVANDNVMVNPSPAVLVGLLYEAADPGGRSIKFIEIHRSALGSGGAN